MNNLIELGFTAHFEALFAPHSAMGRLAGRVVAEYTHLYRVATAEGDVLASVTGKLRHDATAREDFPAVGDWVALHPEPAGRAVIHAVLPRVSKFSRRAAGGGGEQIVAANVTTVFLVGGLDADFNMRRLERYVALAWESGAQPVVVLNKADVASDLDAAMADAEASAPGVPVVAVSAVSGAGFEHLAPYLAPGKTVALLGSSGVGKSTLANRLAGRDWHATQAIRDDDAKGRHTTTHRELVMIPGGALLIDTPGMRELGMWDAEDGLAAAFTDVEALAADCRFSDCGHASEPGCAVREGVSSERLASYHKLQRELAHLERKADPAAAANAKARWKAITKAVRQTRITEP